MDFTERKISVAIAYYNNSGFMEKTLETLINDERINEIVITDDKSSDIFVLEDLLKNKNCSKIKLFYNDKNLGCYHNKINAVSKCSNDWCILLDSDNFIEKSYIDTLYKIKAWDKDTIYSPDRPITFPGNPSINLDFRKYSGKYISNEIYLRDFNIIKFQCLINNCNYFLPCKEYTLCMKEGFETYNREIIDCLDSAVLFTDWIKNKNKIMVVKDLSYYHRLHPNSNYMNGRSRQYERMVKNKLYTDITNIQ
jgi:glycosyltransferase involved in cell wall biosynthesis|tara:strand:+ start:520 stop:1275 length:756 start_codon:yes stop_codon:yes gene_type:complete